MPIALVTGASSGIGEALAHQFASHHYDLVLVARSVDKLEALAEELAQQYDVRVWVEPSDLSRRTAARQLAANVRKLGLEIDVLVNNAGVLEHAAFIDLPASDHARLIDLNVSGLTNLLVHFLPHLVARGSGRILNVASIAAFQPVPGLSTYAATKAYVLSLTESLAEELRDTGVTVTALCPGMTATSMMAGAQEKSQGLKKIPAFMIGDVEEVAEEGYRACLRGDVVCVPGALNLATTVTGRMMPKWLLRRLSGVVGRYTTKGR